MIISVHPGVKMEVKLVVDCARLRSSDQTSESNLKKKSRETSEINERRGPSHTPSLTSSRQKCPIQTTAKELSELTLPQFQWLSSASEPNRLVNYYVPNYE